jgi:ketosteroid isomerase-like protein
LHSNMCPDNLPKNLTAVEVESAVRDYWKTFAAKKSQLWQSYYADIALVFGTASKRPEPARLIVLRRQREYLSSGAKIQVEVGNIDVEILGPNCAVAAYILKMHAELVAKLSASGHKDLEEHLENARVTHVFMRYEDGSMRIVHEHISSPA